MKQQIHTEDFQQLIIENAYPERFYSEEGITERIIVINESFGKSSLKEIFFDGVYISVGALNIFKPTILHTKADFETVAMHFCIEGSSHSRLQGSSKNFTTFGANQHNLIYMPYYEGKLELPEYADMKMLEINLTLEFFQRIASEDFPVFKSFFENIRSKSHGILGKHNRTITPRMQWLIKEIVECKQKGYLKRLFLEAKILELFMLQVEMFEEPQLQKQAFLKKKDVDKIVHAQHIILANINTPYTLLELSRQVGINDFKLKRGFKEVFGNTVFGYIHQIRMERAKEKLLQGEMNISEVADYTGYKNRTHFSAAFKKTFGFSPTELINCKGGIS